MKKPIFVEIDGSLINIYTIASLVPISGWGYKHTQINYDRHRFKHTNLSVSDINILIQKAIKESKND